MSPEHEERRPRHESGATTSTRPGEESDVILAERADTSPEPAR